MHLKHLKLSGFKSFVDPTTVPFSSQLVAVVGPNGCGKSNIIDAVRWVMGEGSAKTLRGDSMSDVIFSGSSQRKPVGQASVELIFDNSLGRMAGQYASYQEVSIKRVVTRDGDSSYYLNNTRCRRRDITDLFLGTGAGTRGYSIIGQNTISQLVEAKPDDLRAYFEEAAGVSKYKDRRRETMLRINHTRDNLTRVEDIRRELDGQLQRLERQAKTAERYKTLRQAERECKADILALKWRHVQQEQTEKQAEMNQLALVVEEHQASLANLVKQQVQFDAQLQTAQDQFQTTQTRFYEVGNEVARLEEMKRQQAREKEQLALEQQQIHADIQAIETQLEQDTAAHQACQVSLAELTLSKADRQHHVDRASLTVAEKQQQASDWGQRQQAMQSALNQAQQEMQVASVHLQHLRQRREDAMLRLDKLREVSFATEGDEAELVLAALQENVTQLTDAHQQALQAQEAIMAERAVLQEQITDVERQLRVAQDQVQTLVKEQARVRARLQAALYESNTTSPGNQLFPLLPRLAELISVEEPWRRVCEWILRDALQAVVVDSLASACADPTTLLGQNAALVTAATVSNQPAQRPCLLDKIDGIKPTWAFSLEHVLIANTLEEAMALLPDLAEHQSVVIPDGVWMGPGWLRTANLVAQDEASLLLQQKALTELDASVLRVEEHIAILRQERDRRDTLRTENEQQQQQARVEVAARHQAMQEAGLQLRQKQQALEQERIQKQRHDEEHATLLQLLETLDEERVRLDDDLNLATQRHEEYQTQSHDWLAEKSMWEEALIAARAQYEEAREAHYRIELDYDRMRLRTQQLSEGVQREQGRLDKLIARRLALVEREAALSTLDSQPGAVLDPLLEEHERLEGALKDSRDQVEALQAQLHEVLQMKTLVEQQRSAVQDQLVQLQLTEQTCLVRASTLVEASDELGIVLDAHVQTLPMEMTVAQREQDQSELSDKVARLGAVNLVAIEEYQTELTRKTYLDDQSRDLNEALDTLMSAIDKMDQETRLRMQETFDQVNALFQALFPRLFGGGNACLQLTCDNLLEAGVIIMAQPPGKRNSSIQMLSGGEKAMTAVALVFAIFQLNPSPFCMLDEVDAPLDDLNVGRFCDLVKEMSQYVQFLLITHNKVTMELADHLIGVTMREPGVSRIVAVDVEQALHLTADVS